MAAPAATNSRLAEMIHRMNTKMSGTAEQSRPISRPPAPQNVRQQSPQASRAREFSPAVAAYAEIEAKTAQNAVQSAFDVVPTTKAFPQMQRTPTQKPQMQRVPTMQQEEMPYWPTDETRQISAEQKYTDEEEQVQLAVQISLQEQESRQLQHDEELAQIEQSHIAEFGQPRDQIKAALGDIQASLDVLHQANHNIGIELTHNTQCLNAGQVQMFGVFHDQTMALTSVIESLARAVQVLSTNIQQPAPQQQQQMPRPQQQQQQMPRQQPAPQQQMPRQQPAPQQQMPRQQPAPQQQQQQMPRQQQQQQMPRQQQQQMPRQQQQQQMPRQQQQSSAEKLNTHMVPVAPPAPNTNSGQPDYQQSQAEEALYLGVDMHVERNDPMYPPGATPAVVRPLEVNHRVYDRTEEQ